MKVLLLMRNPARMSHYHNLPQQSAKAIVDGLVLQAAT